MAYYNFKKKPALTTKEGEKNTLYAGIVYCGTIDSETLIKEVANRSGFKEGQLAGALIELMEETARYIGKGYRVELGEFGVFSGKIKSRLVANKNDIRSPSIAFNGVNFRASKKFRMYAAGELERSPYYYFRKSREQDEDTLERIVTEHIAKYGFITRATYTKLTGRLKARGLQDLKQMVEKGIIQQMGRGNQMHFVKKDRVE